MCDRVLILENAYYSVISPEGCAAILWKDRTAAPKAAEALKITANHLKELGLVDEIIKEPLGGAHRNWENTSEEVGKVLTSHMDEVSAMDSETRLRKRYEKFRAFGHFEEPQPA